MVPGRGHRARLRPRPRRVGLVHGPDRAARLGLSRRPRGPLGQRGQGDADGGLPQPRRRARARAARRRPRPAVADDPAVGQPGRVARARHRGQRVAAHGWPAGPACAASPPRPRWGAHPDQHRRPDALVPEARPLRGAPPPRHRAAAAGLDRPLPALGHRARPATRMEALLQGRLGRRTASVDHQMALLHPRRPAGGRGDHDHGQRRPRRTATRRSRAWRGGCCAASARTRCRARAGTMRAGSARSAASRERSGSGRLPTSARGRSPLRGSDRSRNRRPCRWPARRARSHAAPAFRAALGSG